MKSIFAISVLCLIVQARCGGQDPQTITSVEFTKQSRGFLEQITVSKDSIHSVMENHRAGQRSAKYGWRTGKEDWQKVLNSLHGVSLKHVESLRSPTRERAHDAAFQSSLTITFEDGKSISHSFDDENPHADLKPLLDVVLTFRKGVD
jgi:hypothetical protein